MRVGKEAKLQRGWEVSRITYAMELVVQIDKHSSFKTVRCNYIADGVEAVMVDVRDGQEYSLVIKPLGITLSSEAMDDMLNPEALEGEGA
jgi:hypothetical protein